MAMTVCRKCGVFALVLFAACSTEPSRELAPGTFDYTMSFPQGDYSGVLIINSATEDAVTGGWDVAGYEGAFIGPSGWNGDAYLVGARIIQGRYYVNHRIKPSLECSGKAVIGTVSGGLQSDDITCTLVRR